MAWSSREPRDVRMVNGKKFVKAKFPKLLDDKRIEARMRKIPK
jgi:hypothetical protein